MEFFKRLTSVELVNVYYKSTPQVIADLITGQIGMTFTAIGSDILNSPEIRPVGITALSRSSAFKDVPTFSELGVKGFESGTPTMLLAPKGTSKEIIEALHNAIKVTLADPGTQSRLDQIGPLQPARTTRDNSFSPKWPNGVRFFVKRRISAGSLCGDKCRDGCVPRRRCDAQYGSSWEPADVKQ
jgi:tripartite-type tricarboxylate transporter receptor subunit TctC